MNLLIMTGALLAYGGLAANGLSIDRHYADIHGRSKEPDPRLRLRCRSAGWLGIVLSLAACVAARGWHTGPVLWCGLLTASAIALALLFQYRPALAPRLAWAGAMASVLLVALDVLA